MTQHIAQTGKEAANKIQNYYFQIILIKLQSESSALGQLAQLKFTINKGRQKFEETEFMKVTLEGQSTLVFHSKPKLNFVILNYTTSKAQQFSLKITERKGIIQRQLGQYGINCNVYVDSFLKNSYGAFQQCISLQNDLRLNIQIYIEKKRFLIEKLVRQVHGKQEKKSQTKLYSKLQKIIENNAFVKKDPFDSKKTASRSNSFKRNISIKKLKDELQQSRSRSKNRKDLIVSPRKLRLMAFQKGESKRNEIVSPLQRKLQQKFSQSKQENIKVQQQIKIQQPTIDKQVPQVSSEQVQIVNINKQEAIDIPKTQVPAEIINIQAVQVDIVPIQVDQVQIVPIEAVQIQIVPIQEANIQFIPVQVAPIQSNTIEIAPIEAPVQSQVKIEQIKESFNKQQIVNEQGKNVQQKAIQINAEIKADPIPPQQSLQKKVENVQSNQNNQILIIEEAETPRISHENPVEQPQIESYSKTGQFLPRQTDNSLFSFGQRQTMNAETSLPQECPIIPEQNIQDKNIELLNFKKTSNSILEHKDMLQFVNESLEEISQGIHMVRIPKTQSNILASGFSIENATQTLQAAENNVQKLTDIKESDQSNHLSVKYKMLLVTIAFIVIMTSYMLIRSFSTPKEPEIIKPGKSKIKQTAKIAKQPKKSKVAQKTVTKKK